MSKETINTENGEKIVLTISLDGYCFCPVCGEKSKEKHWRPYDNEGHPSYDICLCGFDDGGQPPFDKSWDRYRQKWLDDEIDKTFGRRLTKSEKLEQPKNLEA